MSARAPSTSPAPPKYHAVQSRRSRILPALRTGNVMEITSVIAGGIIVVTNERCVRCAAKRTSSFRDCCPPANVRKCKSFQVRSLRIAPNFVAPLSIGKIEIPRRKRGVKGGSKSNANTLRIFNFVQLVAFLFRLFRRITVS